MRDTILSMRQQGERNSLLIASFIALNALDAIITLAGYARGGYELNFIARYALENQMLWLFWGHKIITMLILTILLVFLATEYPKQLRWTFVGLVALSGGVCLFNYVGVLL